MQVTGPNPSITKAGKQMMTQVSGSDWRESDFIPYAAEQACPVGRVLVLAPHADDEVLGCGGAIMRHLEAGDPVAVIIATDSDYGRFDAGQNGRDARRSESMAAAAVLGYGAPSFWGLADRGLAYGEALIARVSESIDALRADIVYAPSWWEIHPDHYALALAAAEAVRRCPRPVQLALYEVGVPLHPNRLLDITRLFARKNAAMACFPSQLRLQRYDRHVRALNRFRTYTLPAEVLAAEAYRLVSGRQLQQEPLRAVRPGLYYARCQTAPALPPLVSVVILCRDAERFADALDSVVLQTYPRIEMLSLRAIGEAVFGSPPCAPASVPLRVIEPRADLSTTAKAANRAIAMARGDYVLFLDDGDSLLPDHVSALLRALQDGAPASCCCAGVQQIYLDQGKVVLTEDWIPEQHPTDPDALRGATPGAMLFERALFEAGCRFDEHLSGDALYQDFWLKIARQTELVALPRITARHRRVLQSGEAAG